MNATAVNSSVGTQGCGGRHEIFLPRWSTANSGPVAVYGEARMLPRRCHALPARHRQTLHVAVGVTTVGSTPFWPTTCKPQGEALCASRHLWPAWPPNQSIGLGAGMVRRLVAEL